MKSSPRRLGRTEAAHLILAFDEAARVLARCDVSEGDVAFGATKQRDSPADEYRYACDDETLNEPGAKKPLDGDATVDVDMLNAARGELRHDVGWLPRQPLDHGFDRGGGERARAEGGDRFLSGGPAIQPQNRLVGVAADDHGIHRGHELFVSVWFAPARREKIEGAVGSRHIAVEAGANKDRCFHAKSA